MTIKVRHPLLKLGSPHSIIYKFIKNNPGCTRNHIARYGNLEKNVVSRRTAELKNAGLIQETGYVTDEECGRKVATLEIIDGMNHKRKEKTIKVNVFIYRDSFGRLSSTSAIQGEETNVNFDKTLIARKQISVQVPTEEDYSLQTFAANKDVLTLDAVDYEVI